MSNKRQKAARARWEAAQAEQRAVLEAWLRKPDPKRAPPDALPAARALVRWLLRQYMATSTYARLAREDAMWLRAQELKARGYSWGTPVAPLSFKSPRKKSFRYDAAYWKSKVRSPTLKGTICDPVYELKTMQNWASGLTIGLKPVESSELQHAHFSIDTLDSSCDTIESACRVIEWLRAAIAIGSDRSTHSGVARRVYDKKRGSGRKYAGFLSSRIALRGRRGRSTDGIDHRRARVLNPRVRGR